MPSSDAQKKAVREYQKKCDAIMLRPLKEDGEVIRAAAAKAGISTQGYILNAVQQKIEADATGKYLVTIDETEAQRCAQNANQTLKNWLKEHQKNRD